MQQAESPFAVLLSLLFTVLAAFGVAYWAYRARTDRSAFVGLYLLFGIPGGLLLVAGTAVAVRNDPRLGSLLLAIGLALAVPLLRPVRAALARVLPIDADSPMDMTGLTLVLVVIAFNGAPLLFPESAQPPDPSLIPSVGYLELIAQGAAFLAIAYLAVGWPVPRFDRERDLPYVRTAQEATRRLGIVMPDLRTIAVGVGAVIPCFLLAGIVGVIGNALQPGLDEGLNEVVEQISGNVQTIPGALVLGLSAGIGEEAIFRGALQPRLGIGLTSVCFALLHGAQYGLNASIVGLFLVSVVLGLERKYLNTTAAIITHALFNFIQVAALSLM